MTRVLRRFRMLVPRSEALIGYALIYLLTNLPILVVLMQPGPQFVPPSMTTGRRIVQILGLILYGMYRAFAFHPIFRTGYRTWLETTPWNWRKPLPVGPAWPVWEDALIVSTLAAPGIYFGDVSALSALSLALGGYAMSLCLSFGSTGSWGFQYPVAALVGLAIRIWDGPAWGFTGAVLLAVAVALVGLGRSLKRWPWGDARDLDINKLEKFASNGVVSSPAALGWPYDRVGPRRDASPSARDAIGGFLVCILIGWWFFAISALVTDENGRLVLGFMVLLYVTIFATIYRISRFFTGYAPPLSLGGRLARLRPLLPSYDQGLIAPLAALIVASSGPWSLHRSGLAWDTSCSVTLTLVLVALFLGGPDRRRWQLIARHRIVPAMSSSTKTKGGFVQVG